MSASRHTYAVVVPGVTNAELEFRPVTGIIADPDQPRGLAVYGSKRAAVEYRASMAAYYSSIPYEVIQLR